MDYLIMPFRYVMILFLSTLVTGCASIDLTSWDWKMKHQFATPKKPVYEIVALWEPAEGKGVDGMPTRGFAGQLLFFQHNNPSPVYVKGGVMIHLFDDQGDLEDQTKPIHQYKFDSGAWQAHAVESTLGPGYQVFIPYVRKGRIQTECALRVQLTQQRASDVYSRMVSVKLEGTTPETRQPSLTQNQQHFEAKGQIEVDTLARRETGKRLELSREHKQIKFNDSEQRQELIQQTKAESLKPVLDDRDERIRQLENQMARLLDDQRQQSKERFRNSENESIPANSTSYRKFRLSGSVE